MATTNLTANDKDVSDGKAAADCITDELTTEGLTENGVLVRREHAVETRCSLHVTVRVAELDATSYGLFANGQTDLALALHGDPAALEVEDQ